MERLERSVEVDCPIRTVYNQWTQFEEFPRFMSGVKKVKQLDDTHVHFVHWHAEVEPLPGDRTLASLARQIADGGWRGEVHGGQREPGASERGPHNTPRGRQ